MVEHKELSIQYLDVLQIVKHYGILIMIQAVVMVINMPQKVLIQEHGLVQAQLLIHVKMMLPVILVLRVLANILLLAMTVMEAA
jgi:hypothetical protein